MFLDAVFVFTLFLCSSEAGVSLSPCPDGVFEVVDGSASNVINCQYSLQTRGLSADRSDRGVLWRLRPPSKQPVDISVLRPYPQGSRECYLGRSTLSYTDIFSRTVRGSCTRSATEALTISATQATYNLSVGVLTGESLFGNSEISCRISGRSDSCKTDFVSLPSNVSCRAWLDMDTSPWTVHCRCDVGKIYSAMGRYSCRMLVKDGSRTRHTGFSVSMNTSKIPGGDYVTGSCKMAAPLPSHGRNFAVFVEVTPSRTEFKAKLEEIREPSLPRHNCPDYVKEGADVNCSCFAKYLGRPPVTVQWVETNTSFLSLSDVIVHNVTKRTFTCRMTWNGQNRNSFANILVIPEASKKTDQGAHTKGLVTGLGVGLAVMVMTALLLLLLLWRRGWTLPCSGAGTNTPSVEEEQEDNEEETPGTQDQGYLRAGDRETEGRWEDGPPNIYDSVNRSQVGQASVYTGLELRPQRTRPKRAGKKNKKKKKKNVYENTQQLGAREESSQWDFAVYSNV